MVFYLKRNIKQKKKIITSVIFSAFINFWPLWNSFPVKNLPLENINYFLNVLTEVNSSLSWLLIENVCTQRKNHETFLKKFPAVRSVHIGRSVHVGFEQLQTMDFCTVRGESLRNLHIWLCITEVFFCFETSSIVDCFNSHSLIFSMSWFLENNNLK